MKITRGSDSEEKGQNIEEGILLTHAQKGELQVWNQSLTSLATSTKKGEHSARRKIGLLYGQWANDTVAVCAVFGDEAVTIEFDKEDLITLLTELP